MKDQAIFNAADVEDLLTEINKTTRIHTSSDGFVFETAREDLKDLAFHGMILGIEEWARRNNLHMSGLIPDEDWG